jgi:hypothetical protein
MFIFGILLSVMMLVGRKPTTWFLDGNNIIGQKGTPRDSKILVEKLKPTAYAETVVLVFDGKPDAKRTIETEGLFQHVQLEEGMSADDFILEEIAALSAASKVNRAKLVTADKGLRRIALGIRPTVKSVLNPLTFWKKHRLRMSGLKKRTEVVEDDA